MNAFSTLFISLILIASHSANAMRIPPRKSRCLEVAAAAADKNLEATFGGEFHLIRDLQSYMVTEIVDIETGERFNIGLINRTRGNQEFIAFVGPQRTAYVWGNYDSKTSTCTVTAVKAFNNEDQP